MTSANEGHTTACHSAAHRGSRRGAGQVVVGSLAILLGACAVQSSPSASQHLVIGSPSAQPSVATTSAGPSLGTASIPPADVTTVTIRNLSYGPPEITVAVGTVTFVNADTVPHTVTEGQDGVTAPNARFDKEVGVGESIQVTFAEPGDYQITCLFHSEMHLLVHAH